MSTSPSSTLATPSIPTLATGEGVVSKKLSGAYPVHTETRDIACTLSGALHRQAGPHNDPVSVGDRVAYQETSPGLGHIQAVLPRRNKLARRAARPMPGSHAFEQVIAANLDLVVPVFAAAQPDPKWALLDRYLVSAESAEIPALVVITKLDLVTAGSDAPDFPGDLAASGAAHGERASHLETPDWLCEAVETYRQAGYPVLLTSAATGAGLDELRAALRGRKTALLGKSGVGKTSLLNALQPGLGLRVNAVSQATGKGKHTTTHLELFDLPGGGAILDTPGIREFGLWEVDGSDLALFFPEMRPFVGHCRFGLDCAHDEEPGCAVRKAVRDGQVSPLRYRSYLRLREDA